MNIDYYKRIDPVTNVAFASTNINYYARIAPFINVAFTVTSVWWEQPRNHRGLDIATPYALGNVPVYSMCNGTIIFNGEDVGGYGYYIIMKDSTTNMGFLYAHLNKPSPLAVGTPIVVGQYVGNEGQTGHATGIHLHVEMQDLTNHGWIYGAPKETYSNPAEFMGFPNQEGIWIYYDGTPIDPPTPTPTFKRVKFPWVLYARKNRNKFTKNE